MSASPLLSVRSLVKTYPGVQALKGVDVDIRPGEVHSLVGENGAGKSTLIKILAGAESRDAGAILWRGEPVEIANPHEAALLGISVIHQDLNLVPDLSAAENMLLGRGQPRRFGVLVDWRRSNARAQEAAALVGAEFNVRTPVHELSHAERVLTAIARTLVADAALVVMDEPTAALSAPEIERLHAIIRDLSARGTAVLYVSHRLEEVMSISDAITVFKDGSLVGTFARHEVAGTGALAELIIGRETRRPHERAKRPAGEVGEVVVELRNVSLGNVLKDVSMTVRCGEILGLAGLVGSGRSELANVVFGTLKPTSGEVRIQGETVKRHTPSAAVRRGVALLPEDRRRQGSVPGMSVRENTTLASMGKYRRGPFLRRRRERRRVAELIDRFKIKTSGMERPIRELSGGNQQKVIVARWADREPRILLFDEPTQGIDVGAKVEVMEIMRDLADAGCGILFISSELDEVIQVADRVVVLREGVVRAELTHEEATIDTVLKACYGAEDPGELAVVAGGDVK